MKPRTSSLFSLLLLLLLPRPLLCYSLRFCTIGFDDPTAVACDFNEITRFPPSIPKATTDLSVFRNNIQTIRQTDLTGFTKLTSLNLGMNRISHIEDGSFSDLSAVTFLNLNFNQLTNLTDNMFLGLHSLSGLFLAQNKIASLSEFVFVPLKNLQELDLSGNKLVQVRNALLVHPFLFSLSLEENQITSFESDMFPGPLMNLTDLRFSSEFLKKFRIHSDVFPNLKSLRFLNVGSAFEWDISEKSFLRGLTDLRLIETTFPLKTFKRIFQTVDSVDCLWLQGICRFFDKGLLDFACGIPALKKLEIEDNSITVLNDTLLRSCINLTELNLSQNDMTAMADSSLHMLTRLARLKIEDNKLTRIPVAIRNLTSLTYLSLKSNLITEVRCSDLRNSPFLSELNLKSNHISQLKGCVLSDFQNLKVLNLENNFLSQVVDAFGSNLVELYMNQNNVPWIQKDSFKNLTWLSMLDLHSVIQTVVDDGAFEGLLNLKELAYSPSSQSLGLSTDLPQLEKLSMFLSSPESFRESTNITELSAKFPSLTELTIKVDQEICFSFTGSLLWHFKHLKEVSFDKYCCTTPVPTLLWDNHKILRLQFLNCKDFDPDPELFHPLTKLTSLDLTNSNTKSLDFFIEANLTHLEKLILKDNKLTVINESVFQAFPSLKYLDLSGNPFVCDCSNAGFIEWAIRNKQVQVVGAYQYTCSSPSSEEGHFLLDFNVQSCWEFTGFLCFICSSALVLLTLLSSFIFHFLRWQLVYGYYLLLAFLYDSKKRRQGCPHIYDAFVSYNVRDEDWVYGELLPELEGRQGWRLCLHHRDFLPGKPIIENITDAIYSSRKTLCVISRRYLQSEWCSQEIQLASFRLFDEQKDVLVLLFLEELSSNQLSPFYRMRRLVKRRTYLSWTQAQSHKGLFWEKIRRALGSGDEPGDNHNPLTINDF